MRQIPLVSVNWIHPFLEIAETVGISGEELLREADLPSLGVDDGKLLVPTERIYQFAALAARRCGMSDLGLRAGRRLDIETLLPTAERSWAQPGAFRSLESFIRTALESSSNVDLWLERRSSPSGALEFLYLGTFGPQHPAFPVVEQYMVALMVRWVRYGAGRRWNPLRVSFRARAVPRSAVRELVGDAQVLIGQAATSITFAPQPFRGPVQEFPDRGSPVWRRHLRSLEEPGDVASSLRLILPSYLPDGSPSIQRAARLARTSVRTLQRRLHDEGLTYSQLLDDLRHDLAIYLLRDPSREVASVGRELGYRDPAIFTRAFRRWTGTTPSAYRRSLFDSS